MTIDEKYAALRGTTSGFDYMRIVLAVTIVLLHGFTLNYPHLREALWTSYSRPAVILILPMFFALSGFLVAGSLLRAPQMLTFLTYRAVRLVPALAVEVILSALVLGPFVTHVPLNSYFTDPAFFRYFLNIIGKIHYELPGVFTGPENFGRPGIVNLSLWTVPYELECYLALLLLWITGLFKRRFLLLGLLIALIAVLTIDALARPWDPVLQAGTVSGRCLVVAFVAGCALRLFSDRVKLSVPLFAGALLLSIALLLDYRTQYLAMIPAAYVTIYLGLLNPPKNKVILSGDYSYGIYLFAFPIQQLYFVLFPGQANYALHLLFALPLSIAYAQFSWWIIEKPILARKRWFADRVNGAFGALRRRTPILRNVTEP